MDNLEEMNKLQKFIACQNWIGMKQIIWTDGLLEVKQNL